MNALLFINQDAGGSWHLAPLGVPALGLSAAYFSIADAALAKRAQIDSTVPFDAVTQLMAASVEADTSQARRFLSLVQYNDAPAVFNSWSSSSSSVLKIYGLGALIGSGQDSNAVVAASTLSLSQTDVTLLSAAILGYRNPDPAGVAAIGRLSTKLGADPQVILSCVYALAAIHTRESVPYLVQLLDNPDPIVRETAVGGLSAFVAKMRIATDGADAVEARDEVLNPGRRRTLPSSDAPFETAATRQFIHFGSFSDDVEEAPIISFWKNWYQQNQTQF